jgi:integrase/recombinase XerC
VEIDEALGRFWIFLRGERNLSPATRRAYRSDLALFAAYWHKERRGSPIETADRASLRPYLARLGERGGGGPLSFGNTNPCGSFFRFLARKGILPTNPTDGLSRPKPERRVPAFLSEGEAGRLLSPRDAGGSGGGRASFRSGRRDC